MTQALEEPYMIIVLSCCNRKTGNLIHLGKNDIYFVSKVQLAHGEQGKLYCHPDDNMPNSKITWRELIEKQENGNKLKKAYQLYSPEIYRELYEKYKERFFIFSAGWGIIKSDYCIPKYNVTFSKSSKVPKYSYRHKNDIYKDFNHLINADCNEAILLIAGSTN